MTTTPQVPGALTEEQRLHILQAIDYLNDHAEDCRRGGTDSVADGCAATAWVLSNMLKQVTLPEPAAAPAAGGPVKRWPFVETPGEFTQRLEAALLEFGALLPAVRNVLIENPPALAAATPSVPQTHPVHQALPSLGLHATEGRAETCELAEGAAQGRQSPGLMGKTSTFQARKPAAAPTPETPST